ncbi:MAG: hypothetical protein ABIF71_03150 [Planctomycetota bacterium]
MDSRARMIATLEHKSVDRVPRELWALPGVGMFRKAELDAVSARFPADTAGPDFAYGVSTRRRGVPNTVGVSTDEWGCTFHVAEPGVVRSKRYTALNVLFRHLCDSRCQQVHRIQG